MTHNVPDSKLGQMYKEHLDFIVKHDLDSLLRQYAEDCLLISSFTPDRKPLYVRGKAELTEFFKTRIFTLAEIESTIDFWAENEKPEESVLMIVESLKFKGIDGSSASCRFYDNWVIRNGQIHTHFAGTVQFPDGTYC